MVKALVSCCRCGGEGGGDVLDMSRGVGREVTGVGRVGARLVGSGIAVLVSFSSFSLHVVVVSFDFILG